MKKKEQCLTDLLSHLDGLEMQVSRVKEQLRELKSFLSRPETLDEEEVCQDEIDADAAAFEAIQEICLESLLDIEPKGDA